MNEQEFKNRIEERWGDHRTKSRGRIMIGVILFFAGILWLLKETRIIEYPDWLIDWPILVILIGLVSGIKHNFRGGPWVLFILGGVLWIFFKQNGIDRDFIWPIILSAIGLMFILRPRGHRRWRNWDRDNFGSGKEQSSSPTLSGPPSEGSAPSGDYDRRDFIDITSVFGGTKKNVLSKNFKGGDITSFMGGSEIDLSQADFTGTIRIDATNIFGGTKLIVPPTWDVQNDITAVFGGVDDKRQIAGVTLDPNKVLILDGTCMFGGIEIRSY